jgi:hypothetical protein
MAKFRVHCPACNEELELDERHEGEEVECGSCFERFVAKAPVEERPSRRSRRRNDDDDDYQEERPRRRRRRVSSGGGGGGGGNGPAVTSLICGILAVMTSCFCGCLSIPLAIMAIGSGIAGMRNPEGKGMAVAGLCLGVLALALFAVALIAGIGMNLANLNNAGGFRRGR